MKVLIICRPMPGVTPTAMAPHLQAEAAQLRAMKSSGVLLEAFSPGGPGAVLVIQAENPSDAEHVAAALPMRQASLIDVELIELHPLDY